MALGKPTNNESNWISFSDIMTGLMVIFMFIAISFMYEVQQKIEGISNPFIEFKAAKDSIYSAINREFSDDFKEWNVELEKDLTIKFSNLDVLFEKDSHELRHDFKTILKDFFPDYLRILQDEDFTNKIDEIRIEGHSDNSGEYLYNLELSQQRAAEVLRYIRENNYFKDPLDSQELPLLEYWITANGYSYGRTLDSNKEFTFFSTLPMDSSLSRRVEFKVILKNTELLKSTIERIDS